MIELIFLLVFSLLSLAFAVASLVASVICAYKNDTSSKSEIYECGMKLFSDAKLQFDVKYFNFALMFLIFDVETVLLFPFAVNFSKFNIFVILEIFLFVIIFLFALFYAIKTNMLGDRK